MKRSSTEVIEPLAAKVPEITLLFWVIKVLTTGMGEAMSDFLGQKSIPIGGAVGVLGVLYAMHLQLHQQEYRAPVYWFAVAMVAIFGTMVADVLKDGTGVSYAVTTPVFAMAIAPCSIAGTAARARSRCTTSRPADASSTTGPPCWPRSRWAPPPTTSPRSRSISGSSPRSSS